jgi:hypothetical protein
MLRCVRTIYACTFDPCMSFYARPRGVLDRSGTHTQQQHTFRPGTDKSELSAQLTVGTAFTAVSDIQHVAKTAAKKMQTLNYVLPF